MRKIIVRRGKLPRPVKPPQKHDLFVVYFNVGLEHATREISTLHGIVAERVVINTRALVNAEVRCRRCGLIHRVEKVPKPIDANTRMNQEETLYEMFVDNGMKPYCNG